jgi:hypothetical protein
MKLDRRATIEDLMLTPEDGRKYELVDGEIVVSPRATGIPLPNPSFLDSRARCRCFSGLAQRKIVHSANVFSLFV